MFTIDENWSKKNSYVHPILPPVIYLLYNNDILWPDHIQWQPPTDQTFYRTRPLTEIWVVSIELLRRVWYADRGRLLLRTPGPVPLGLAYVLLVETNPFPNLSLFYRTMLFEYPSVLSRFCMSSLVLHYIDFHDFNVVYFVLYACFNNCHMGLHRVFDSYIVTRLFDIVPFNEMLLVYYIVWHLQ